MRGARKAETMTQMTTLAVPDPEAAPPYDVCIVGAGPVGAALACRLAEGGLRVAIADRAALPPMEHPAFDGRAYAIAASSRGLLEAGGVWQRLCQPSCPIEEIRVSDGRPGLPASPLFLHFDSAELDAGPFGWMCEARALRIALNATLAEHPRIDVFAPARVTVRFADAQAAIALETEHGPRHIAARLVIAAEGRESPLRAQAGIPVTRLRYGQSGIVCAVAHGLDHHNRALEHFLPGGPFAQLPMSPDAEVAAETGLGFLSAIVWTERTALAERLVALPPETFAREIARRLGPHLGELRPVGRRWIYPLSAMHAHRYTAPRLALVGDAAHGMHPIAGQGLNLGLRDAIALSSLLIDAHAEGRDCGDPTLLAQYQRAQRPPNMAMLAATDALDRLFSTDNPVLTLARRVGIAGVHRMPRLKRVFMARASGFAR